METWITKTRILKGENKKKGGDGKGGFGIDL